MDLIELDDFSPEQYDEIVDGEADPYGTDDLAIEWKPKTGHVALVDDGRIIAHAGWVPAELRAATGEEIPIVGLGGVMVHRDRRGSGLGGPLVTAAVERMARVGPPVGVLFCRTQRLDFYRRLGWQPLGGPITADQPSGSVVMPMVTCWTALAEGATVPDVALHVEGLPF